jgi:hypothetical protein
MAAVRPLTVRPLTFWSFSAVTSSPFPLNNFCTVLTKWIKGSVPISSNLSSFRHEE